MELKRRSLYLLLWGVAFGYIESAVVVYLREIYYPHGFSFPLAPMDENLLLTEIFREAATLLLIWSTAALTFKRFRHRVAAFFILFGIWDIFYYVFLKLLLGWPPSLSTLDILFLIPSPWVGPVWAPVAVSAAMIIFFSLLLYIERDTKEVNFSKPSLFGLLFASFLILLSFIIPGLDLHKNGMPGPFPSYLFFAGYALGVFVCIHLLTAARKIHDSRL